MTDGYGGHREYMERVKRDADARQLSIEAALRDAFPGFIEKREVEVVVFSSMSAIDLSKALLNHPVILKPILACCNVAARAVERDLGIRNLDTYTPRLSKDDAKVLAGYIKPFLPQYLEIPALTHVDRIYFIDKEVRKNKGRWEKLISEALNNHGKSHFKKRTFKAGGETFELDAATPEKGDIHIGIDIKRIEARRDIHKRCDEIVNKARKFKIAFPNSKFGAVVYYPFIDEHSNIQNRLRSTDIDSLVFASESGENIESAVQMLLATFDAPSV